MNSPYETSVFINCPFDEEYEPLFHAIVFAVTYCGFNPRCALEARNGGQVRIHKINQLIRQSKYGIHDISRTAADKGSKLPRFNMPFELGLFLGAKEFGNKKHKEKNCLILEKTQYLYQKYLSDIAGQDVYHHKNCCSDITKHIRDWIVTFSDKPVPSTDVLIDCHTAFVNDLPALCAYKRMKADKLAFSDYYEFVIAWMVEIDAYT